MRIIEEEFEKRGLKIRMIGSITSKEKESVKMIKKFVEE